MENYLPSPAAQPAPAAANAAVALSWAPAAAAAVAAANTAPGGSGSSRGNDPPAGSRSGSAGAPTEPPQAATATASSAETAAGGAGGRSGRGTARQPALPNVDFSEHEELGAAARGKGRGDMRPRPSDDGTPSAAGVPVDEAAVDPDREGSGGVLGVEEDSDDRGSADGDDFLALGMGNVGASAGSVGVASDDGCATVEEVKKNVAFFRSWWREFLLVVMVGVPPRTAVTAHCVASLGSGGRAGVYLC